MILIELTPTRRIEQIGSIKYRVYTGRTNTGIQLEMLGLFRVTDADRRAEFERTVCSVDPSDPAPIVLLSEYGLVKP